MTLPISLTTAQTGANITVTVTVPAGVSSGAGVDAASLTVSSFSTAATMTNATAPSGWIQATNPANGQVGLTDFTKDPTNAVGAVTDGVLVVLNFTLNAGYVIADFVATATVKVTSSSDPNSVTTGASNVVPVPTVACFVCGTRIATMRGEVAVETLAIGDEIVLATGGVSPVRFIGRRSVGLACHPAAERVIQSVSAPTPLRTVRRHATCSSPLIMPYSPTAC